MAEFDLTVSRERVDALRNGATVVLDNPAVFQVTGNGALACLQGIFTNDLEQPGTGSLTYGAMLTPKGMIVVDAWVIRLAGSLLLVAPESGREAVSAIFQRTLPPRLAKATDLTGDWAVAWLIGAHGARTLAQSDVEMPEGSARVREQDGASGMLVVALAPEVAPFAAMLTGPAAAVESAIRHLQIAGAGRGDERDFQAARILAGWPALGIEIDEKTLPQEVRYDEIGGVSYTKGCYTGQETVARLHFRGHTNRELRGLLWREAGAPDGRAVVAREKEVGTVRSTLTVDGRTVGLAVMRREVEPGTEVKACGRGATVVRLPFAGETLDG
jgi:folate-binding protein YgfZ